MHSPQIAIDTVRLEILFLDAGKLTGGPLLTPPLAVYGDGVVEEAEPSYTRALSLAPGTPLREKLKTALRSGEDKTQMRVVLSGLQPEVNVYLYLYMYMYVYIHMCRVKD